jgi:hypothetical protein
MRRFVSFSGSSAMTDEPPFFSDLIHVLRGRAINEYANVEQSLCRLFGTLLGTDLQLGAIVFYRITNTHSRNQILDDLLAEKHGLTYESYWSGVTGAPNRKNTGMWPLIRQLVPRHSDYDWLILSQSRMGKSSGGTGIWMLLATPG